MNNNLDYDLDAVMEEWREENKYRDEADRDHIPEDKDNRTIKSVIKAMEERYFDGKHIFRNGGKNSDFLFRYEIKELHYSMRYETHDRIAHECSCRKY